MRTKRPELVEAHGFDTKYAMHVLRLAVQGREMLQTGRLELPIAEPERSRIRAVREGQVSWDETIAWIDQAERELEVAHEQSTLPDDPDVERAERWLVHAYQRSWRERGLVDERVAWGGAAARSWCSIRSSKPAGRCSPPLGRFDSCAASPSQDAYLQRFCSRLGTRPSRGRVRPRRV